MRRLVLQMVSPALTLVCEVDGCKSDAVTAESVPGFAWNQHGRLQRASYKVVVTLCQLHRDHVLVWGELDAWGRLIKAHQEAPTSGPP